MEKHDLTVVLLAKNEERNLARCLESVSWADKIILVDDNSIDKTIEIAKKHKAEVYKRTLDDFASQRNFAITKVKTKWVLFIDPDEEISAELAQEIQMAIKSDEYEGYRFPRKNIIFGKWIEHAGWYPDYQTHLFIKGKGRYIRKIHEQVEISGQVGTLASPLLHHNYQSITQYLEKNIKYSLLEAENQMSNGYTFVWQDLIRKPVGEFLRRYFAEEGFKDGLHGLALSLLQSFVELMVYIRIWEKEGFKALEIPESIKEIDKAMGELEYWTLKQTKNPIKKILHKLR